MSVSGSWNCTSEHIPFLLKGQKKKVAAVILKMVSHNTPLGKSGLSTTDSAY